MIIEDFTNIDYLKIGTHRQKQAYKELKELKVFENLKSYHPILTGTIPIDIDIPESDLDIICECNNHEEFATRISELFGDKLGFKIKSYDRNDVKCTVAKFKDDVFMIEIFGQDLPTRKQHAYRHMVIEHKILNQNGNEFKSDIRKLKSLGMKTEPAFAKLLGLDGDPYKALLEIEIK